MLHLTEVLGLPVYDVGGNRIGTVVELAAIPTEQPPRVAFLLLRDGKDQPVRSVPVNEVTSLTATRVTLRLFAEQVGAFRPDDSLLLLRKDLLDQQIIDVNGRKVVRVNDVAFQERPLAERPELRLAGVDIGLGGALRRLLIGVVPRNWVRRLEDRAKPASIPWSFVDMVESDPMRRVKLRLSHGILAQLHPADLADIVEKLGPKERQAIFADLDAETAADALAEIKRKLQASILESLDKDRAADIVEEMPPDAAADLLADLSEEKTTELLQDLSPQDAEELGELLELPEHSAGGLMTTDYVAMPAPANARDARNLLAMLPDFPENLTMIFLVDDAGVWKGSVLAAKLVVTPPEQTLASLCSDPPLSAAVDASEAEVVELFDKYNLLALPVLDEEGRLAGIITVDDVITALRRQG
ncbi:MAG: magnesium transporter [Acidobacteria bacterium]|nr:magnesium transporter [Acidobacteriota bacterium]